MYLSLPKALLFIKSLASPTLHIEARACGVSSGNRGKAGHGGLRITTNLPGPVHDTGHKRAVQNRTGVHSQHAWLQEHVIEWLSAVRYLCFFLPTCFAGHKDLRTLVAGSARWSDF